MDLFKITIKLFTETDTFGPTEFIPIFHYWIQNQSLPNHLLIDVADYAHVPAGPGTLVVASEANIHMDRSENRLGLLYVRKQPIPGSPAFPHQLRGSVAETLKAAIKLQSEPELAGRLKFQTNEISIRLNDRLLAPNTEATFETHKKDFESLATDLYGPAPFLIDHYKPSPLTLFEIRIKSGESPKLPRLLERIDQVAAAEPRTQ
jgi:hypothetical protein